jgi:hypothetical protein
MDWFRSALGPAPVFSPGEPERRKSARKVAAEFPAELAWRSPAGLVRSAALLFNVSRDGLLVLSDHAPSAPGELLIRLRLPAPDRWVAARLVQARRIRSGPVQMRLRFEPPVPGWFLAAAVADSARDN